MIDILLDAVRHAVYSAKCLKDIQQNLNSFVDHDNPEISAKIEQQQKQVYDFYEKIFALFEHRHESDYFTEEMTEISHLTDLTSDSNEDRIYTEAIQANFSNVELSTLLNVNKEIHSSCKAFYKAVKRFWIKVSIYDYQ